MAASKFIPLKAQQQALLSYGRDLKACQDRTSVLPSQSPGTQNPTRKQKAFVRSRPGRKINNINRGGWKRKKRKSPLRWFCAYFHRTCTVPEYPLIKTKCLLLYSSLSLFTGNAHSAPAGGGAGSGRLIFPPGINSFLKVRAYS